MMTKSSLFLHTQLAPRQEKQLTDIVNSLVETKTLIFDHRMGYLDILHTLTTNFRYRRLRDLNREPATLCACAGGEQQTIIKIVIHFL